MSNILNFINDEYHKELSPTSESTPLLNSIHQQLEEKGCAIIKNFIDSTYLEQLANQSQSVADKGYFKTVYTNPYSTDDDDSFPQDHPRRYFMERTQGFVANDYIPKEYIIEQIYHDECFQNFIARCLKEEKIYEYADPFGSLVLNVCQEGATHPWHYDTNEFIVSLLTNKPNEGGEFEYCPNIRKPKDENYELVGKVIRDEDRSPVKVLQLNPGDLQIFKGRFALHRVTRVKGQNQRITAIFAYAKEPNMIGQAHRAEKLFGRVHELHTKERFHRNDGLTD